MKKRPTTQITCSNCSIEFEKDRREYNRQLRNGASRFFCSRSCSCIKANEENPKRNDVRHILGYKRQKNELSPYRYYIRKAKHRNKLGQLSVEDLKSLWESQSGKCAYTGINLQLNSGGKQDIRYLASLDRIDSSLPYQDGNVQFVSTAINYAKHDMSHDHFIEFLALITGRTSFASVASRPT